MTQRSNEIKKGFDFVEWRLARRGIRDFTENGGAARAGGGREVRRALVEGLVREKGKGEGFLGVFGNAEAGRGQDFNAGKSGGKLSEDERIVSAAAGDDELVNFCSGENETMERVYDRECGEDRCGADQIVGLGAMPSAEGKDFFHVSVAVIFAAGGFWWRELQIGIAEEFVEERGDAAALQGELRVFVEAAAAAREVSDESVDEHVRRAGVEGGNLLWLSGARKDGDVGDAAEIE